MYRWSELETEMLDLGSDYSDTESELVAGLPDTLLFNYGWTNMDVASEYGAETKALNSADGNGEKLPTEQLAEIRGVADHQLLSAEQERRVARRLSDSIIALTKHLCVVTDYRNAIVDRVNANPEHWLQGKNDRDELFDAILTLNDMLQMYECLQFGLAVDLVEHRQLKFRQLIVELDLDRDFIVELAQSVADHSQATQSWQAKLRSLLATYLESRNILISANVRLVYHIARRHQNSGLEMDDMVQEGVLGLLRAAQKFDVDTGFRFSTYGFWWIKQSIRQAIAKQRSSIRYPFHLNTQITQLYAFSQLYQARHGRKPNIKQMAKGTRFSEKKIKDLTSLSNFCISANSEIFDDGVKTLQDDLAYNDGNLSMEVQLAEIEHRETLQQAMAQLSVREYQVLALKYGLGHRKSYSLNEIAPQFGVSRERIRQIIEEAVEKLKLLLGEDASEYL